MPSAADRKAIVQVSVLFEKLEKGSPRLFSSMAAHECVHIANHDDAAPGPREQYVEPFRRRHEANISP
jgi:hypothetical protein